jgi:hypothetical protein
MRLYYVALLMVAGLSVAACNVSRPRWHQPGPTAVQQYRATKFDPYADTDAGPEVVGGRPREFQRPFAEPVRARTFPESQWSF